MRQVALVNAILTIRSNVTDAKNYHIQVFDPEGEFLRQFVELGIGDREL